MPLVLSLREASPRLIALQQQRGQGTFATGAVSFLSPYLSLSLSRSHAIGHNPVQFRRGYLALRPVPETILLHNGSPYAQPRVRCFILTN